MRKKSPAKSLETFIKETAGIREFLRDAEVRKLSDYSIAYCYDFAVIWAAREFETFVLDILVAQINRDPDPLYLSIGVNFGVHPTSAQCEYLLVGDRYFDFRGYGGLLDSIRKVSGKQSALEGAVKVAQSRKAFQIMVGLRNYVAHQSDQSKEAALTAMRLWEPERNNLGSAGYWLIVRSGGRARMERFLDDIESLCQDMAGAV